MDGFTEATVRKLDQVGIQPRPPLAVNLQVSSRHVNSARREVVRLHLSSNERPMNYSFRCYRVADRSLPGELGDLVFEQSRFCQEEELDFEWSGLNGTGQPASNGRYQMRVWAEDLLRRYQTFDVEVQVNNQGAR